MARQVRSVREQEGVAVQRLECAQCELSWNRPRKPGPVPRFCSDACKQANWRDRVGKQEYNRRRRESTERRARASQIRSYHAEFDRITAATPLPAGRAFPLLHELAGTIRSASDPASLVRLYRTASVAWHPDKPGGDHKVFQLLQEAYRQAKLLTS
ncbi:J domain-containing protein [Streptomyces sp. NPDC094034]|uniref:J domain-containing protein n=1 Tax=Streptomyces sp. NPDC094034 TaxID=3155309 RepID=UPI00332EED94